MNIQSNSAVSLKNIVKIFKAGNETVNILNKADFEIKRGDTVAITGESGTGKSTLLHIMGTLLKPDSGSIEYFGQSDVYSLSDANLARFRNKNIGFVFQFHYLLNEFSCLENAAMPLLIRKENKNAAFKIAKDYLCEMGLEKRLNFKPYMLSGGEQQRAAIARALVCSPEVILMDEPTGNLDPRHAEKLHEIIIGLNKKYGKTLAIVTHDANFSAMMSRKIKISNGLIEEVNL
ncbi:MAG: ABC transporter ATP-binding protein [Candidatus Acidulodesulfobacterium acidiphilum]|uniref:ABC transporter ATP-binding protein n=1 Tax=Candidatus Acidulodesulfobacterium acidiphilum TaxID=2597224 RepID=A0A520XEP7_9DELT|nr:MAG: ABC transporter ATP-binding protein [Candidatus Acidulodesulfobacterium acidiphilum]